jgi:4'-phosphopantetheinyl transferase
MTSQKGLWLLPPVDLRLSSGEIHVWRAALDLPVARFHSLQQTLSEDELVRAKRFYFEKDRQHFTIARGLLRVILGRYLGTEPKKLRFCYNNYGKPALANEFSQKGEIEFNLSHTNGIVLYAVACGHKVGVDIERIRIDLDYQHLAARFFSPLENTMLGSVPPKMRAEAFFTCWTRKEAYIKARGEGLSLPLDQFDVSLIPGEPAMLLNFCGDPQKIAHWSLQELVPGPDYVATLAVEGHSWQLRCLQYPEWD